MPYWKLYYHIVWSTKERLPLIQPEFETELHKVIAAKAVKMDAIVYAVGGIENHVHIAASIPPKISLADFIGQIKGNSSHYANQISKEPFNWQNEYGIVSFGEKQLEQIILYIKNQRLHHNEGTQLQFLEKNND